MEMLQVSRVFFFFFYLSVLVLVVLPTCSHCETVMVDGVSEWKNPTVNIGDSIIFRHKYHYSLYIFRSRTAFDVCDFNQATPLTKTTSPSYTWRPSRLGDFYFAFYNGTDKPCKQGQKLAVKVIPVSSAATTVLPPAPAPESPAPVAAIEAPESPVREVAGPPTAGGVVSSSPAYPWPFQPREPGSAPAPLATAPLAGGSVPFINSNPAVPLPTGEVDSATIHPLPTSAEKNHASRVVVCLVGVLFIPQCIAVLLML